MTDPQESIDENEIYLFHQTPKDIAKKLIPFIPIEGSDILYEPFRGEGAFFDSFPESNPKQWTEIKEQKDYKEHNGTYDWVISNPPFRLPHESGRRVNSFWLLLDYFTQRARKGVAFLGNDYCLGALTKRRLRILKERGFTINRIVVSEIKKWRGRYYFIIVEKNKPTNFYLTID